MLFNAHAGELWRALLVVAGGRADLAEEATAEAYSRLLASRRHVREPRAWLYRTGLRIVVTGSPAGSAGPGASSETAAADPGASELSPELTEALRSLSPNQRMAVFLTYQAGGHAAERGGAPDRQLGSSREGASAPGAQGASNPAGGERPCLTGHSCWMRWPTRGAGDATGTGVRRGAGAGPPPPHRRVRRAVLIAAAAVGIAFVVTALVVAAHSRRDRRARKERAGAQHNGRRGASRRRRLPRLRTGMPQEATNGGDRRPRVLWPPPQS